MMARYWMPGALRKQITRNYTAAPRKITNAVVLHVAVSEAATLAGWFNNPQARASSHFYIRRDGTVEQYIPINLISWAGVASDQRAISVETQGMGHGAWTQAQLDAIDRVLRYCRGVYPEIPIRQMASSKATETGIGWHALGVPASAWQKARGVSQTGGELWSGAVGKTCPGRDRIRQIPGIVNRLKGATRYGTKPAPAPKAKTARAGYGVPVTKLQGHLKEAGFYKGLIDGDYGPMTRDAVLAYQRNQRYMPGLLVDGQWGPLTQQHYDWVRRLQNTINKWRTAMRIGQTRVDGDYGPYVDRLVRQTIHDNFNGAYTKAVRAVYGRFARPVNDGLPGVAFCRMVNIPAHPTA